MTILPSSSCGVELHRLAAVPAVGQCRIGNVEGHLFRSRPPVSRVDKLHAAKGLITLQSGSFCEGRRQRLGFEESYRGARPLLTSKTIYSLPTSRPERHCPLTCPGPDRGRIQKQRQAVQPRRSSGRLRHSEAVVAFGGSRLREAALPCMGRALSGITLCAKVHA